MIDAEALHPLSEKTTAIQSAPAPKTLHNLSRSWVCYNSIIDFILSSYTRCTTVYFTSKGSNI